MTNPVSFVEELLCVVPELQLAYTAHLNANGTLLPHVLIGDVTRFVIAEASKPSESTTLARLLDFLEEGLATGREDVKELIVVSFVENLIGEREAIQSLKALMGPNLKKQVEAICG